MPVVLARGLQNIAIWGFNDPISSWTHFLAAFGFFVASFPLIRRARGHALRVTSIVVYCFSLVFLFSMSGTFHLLSQGGEARGVLQRLDHAGIWVLIAGTFTPIHSILFRGPWRWLILLVVWVIAITGLTLEVVFFRSFPEWLALSFFLGLGWMGLLTGYKFRDAFRGESYFWLVAGGVFYSIGAVIDFVRWPVLVPGYFGAHELFHLFVILGAVAHWKFIWNWAAHPVRNSILFQVRVFSHGLYRAEALTDHLIVEGNSLEEVKAKIRQAVSEKYHHSIQPQVHLRFYQEEVWTEEKAT